MSSNISSSNMNFYSNIYAVNKVFAIIKVRNKKKWTKEEDLKLIKLAERNKEKHWKEISKNFLNKNPLQCFSRYKRIKPGIIKGTWTKEEDDRILSLVSIYGKSWSKLAKIMKSRNGKQIRDRFINVLDPEVKKGKFTYKEDKKIKELYVKYGPRWATIARGLPNRTPDMIKNRFHSSIKKFLYKKNFLSKSINNSKKTSRESASNLNGMKTPLKNSNSASVLNISNSQNILDKNFLNNFSNFSSSIQEVNSEQNVFQNKLDQMFYSDNRISYNQIPLNFDKETNIYVNENENTCNPFDKIFSFENFTNNVKNEFRNLRTNGSNVIIKKHVAEVFNDSERTVSNSVYSFKANERNDLCSKFRSNHDINKNELNENKFDFPEEQVLLSNFLTRNSKNNTQTILYNCKNNNNNNDNFNKNKYNYQNNCLKDNNPLCNFDCRGEQNHYFNDSTFTSDNLNKNLEKENKFNEENKIIKCNMKLKSNKKSEANELKNNDNVSSKKNKLIKNQIIKNEQEFEEFNSNKVLEIKIAVVEKDSSDVLKIESHSRNASQYNNEFESQANKNYFLNCNENSRSTNLVTCQNISTYSSNSYSLDENEHSSNENFKNHNGNPYIISGIDDIYQLNFMNFADSPFRMNSPKYYDFEDYFNSN